MDEMIRQNDLSFSHISELILPRNCSRKNVMSLSPERCDIDFWNLRPYCKGNSNKHVKVPMNLET